jgi:preprotein translocase subunit SecA
MMTCGCTYRVESGQMGAMTQEKLFDALWAQVKQLYEEKTARFGEAVMRNFERGVFLMVIDNLWKDHLYIMDQLKGGVQYTAFGQKNPLYEYQREGRKLFELLLSTMGREITRYLFSLQQVEQPHDRMGLSQSRAVHSEFDTYAGAEQPGGAIPQPAAKPSQMITNRADSGPRRPVVRTTKPVGRNDPCPCGSGKKYKKCHGRE